MASATPGRITSWSGRAVDGDLGTLIRNSMDKAGLYAFEKIWDNGFRQISSSTYPIRTPDDQNGYKIRVPVSPLWTSMLEALGAAPASINFNEVYSALQTKIVEGQENPLVDIVRGAEVCLDDPSYVGRLYHAGQWT